MMLLASRRADRIKAWSGCRISSSSSSPMSSPNACSTASAIGCHCLDRPLELNFAIDCVFSRLPDTCSEQRLQRGDISCPGLSVVWTLFATQAVGMIMRAVGGDLDRQRSVSAADNRPRYRRIPGWYRLDLKTGCGARPDITMGSLIRNAVAVSFHLRRKTRHS